MILFCLLVAAHYAGNAQNAYYDALYISTYNANDLQRVLDGVPNVTYRVATGGGLTNTTNTPIAVPLTTEEITHVTRLRDFYSIAPTVFAPGTVLPASPGPFSSTDDIDLAQVRKAIEKYNTLVESMSKSAMPGVNTGTYAINGFVGGAALLSGAASLLPKLVGGKGGGISLSAEQQTTIIDGLTKYYAEEFKKAQMLTYMHGIKVTMEKFPDLPILFPETFEKLQNTDPARFPDLGEQYKDIFSKDLKNMLRNVIDYVENYTPPAGIAANPPNYILFSSANINTIQANPYYTAMRLGCDVGDKLINKYPLPDLFEYLETQYGTPAAGRPAIDATIAHIVKSVNALQFNLRDTTSGKTWVSMQQLQQLTPTQQAYFAALMYRRHNNLFPSITAANYTNAINAFKKIEQTLIELEELRKTFKDKAEEESYEQLFMATIRLVETYNSLLSIPAINTGGITALSTNQVTAYVTQAKHIAYLYSSIRKGDYSNIAYYTMQLVKDKVNTAGAGEVIEKIDTYGAFMTETINAKTSDDVKAVVKKFAAPPSSFILKRERAFTISLTGQPGYFGSIETLDNDDAQAFTHGITLPMGAEFTFKLKPSGNSAPLAERDNSASLSVFFQLIDLGAVLNYRLANDTSAGLPVEVTLEQIYSPGISLNYGFKNSPVNIGVGYQRVPKLRNFTDAGVTQLANGNRVFLRVAWDIPFINVLKTKER